MSREKFMKFSRLSAIWLFWPAVVVVVWGELSPSAGNLLHIWDKLEHFTAYFGLAGLATVALGTKRRALWAALALVVLGGMLEIIQGYTGRDMSIYDEFANMLGVTAGAIVARSCLVWLGPRSLAGAEVAD